MRLKRLLLGTVFFVGMCAAQETFFSKVIIWGHPQHSHTHSYIHEAFCRAFKHLGYETYWVSSVDEIKNIDLAHALFITEGQVDKEIPKRSDCYYILHNCARCDYQELFCNNRCIILQVYTHDCLPYADKIDEYIYGNVTEKMIFMPWATDLLPYEIDQIKQCCMKDKKELIVNWVGSIGGGFFGNNPEIEGFRKACSENNIVFKQVINISIDETIDLIKKSSMAPAIQGAWQCEKGYIPCRIFKNISYGQWGITNNKTVYDLFKGKIVYNPDTYQLFYDAAAYIDNAPTTELYELMDFVKDNHTYVNRIDTLLQFMKRALTIKENDEVF